jgi:Xaa-Pro aminopeptidase
MALEYGGRVDFARLRRERLERLCAEMEREQLDALLLGREANARYASGARRLWTAGMRPFGPGCAVLREGPEVHLLSTWDEGIPPEIPREHLLQTTWDPARLAERLARIPGLAGARRVGVDGMTPLFERLLPAALPGAQWVDASPALQRARARKTPDELECLRTALAVAEGALAAVVPGIRPGADERALRGRFCQEIARQGLTIPALEPSFCATPRRLPPGSDPSSAPLRQLPSDRPLEAGDLVLCHAGAMYAGYEGGVGRSLACAEEPSVAQRALSRRLDEVMGALRDACRPGARSADACRAYTSWREPLPPLPILHGVGLGVEPPLVGRGGDPGDARLEAGMTVALQGYVWREGVGGCFARETWLLEDGGARRLDRLSRGL